MPFTVGRGRGSLVCWWGWVVLVGFCLAPMAGSGADWEVRTGADDVAVEPGRLVTRHLIIENRSARARELVEEMVLPKGWMRVTTADEVFPMEAGGSQVRIVAFSVPRGEPGGWKSVGYRLRDRADGEVLVETQLRLEVRPWGRMEVIWSETPGMVLSGESISLAATLVNLGNCAIDIELRSVASPAFGTAVERRFRLEVGGREEVAWEIQTDPALTRRILCVVQTRIEGRWADEGHVSLPSHSAAVEVLPSSAPSFDPYVRLPVALAVTTAWERGRDPSIQSELRGRGALNEEGDQRLDFVFRGPDAASANSSLRRREEYGMSLSGGPWELHLGDREYASSPLLRRFGLERGVGLDLRGDGWEVGGYVSQGREGEGEASVGQASGYLGWRGNDGLGVRYQMLMPGGSREPGLGLHSVGATWERSDRFRAEWEGAWDTAAGWGSGTAWRAEMQGRMGLRGGWHASRSEAGVDFSGSITGSESTAVGMFYELSEALRVAGEWRNYRSQAGDDPDRSPTETHDTRWRWGPRYRFADRTTLSLDLMHTRQERGDEEEREDWEEHGVGVTLGREFERVGVQLSQEVGRRSGADLGSASMEGVVVRSGLLGTWRPGDAQWYSAAVGVEADGREFGSARVQGSVSGTWRVGGRGQASVSVQHTLAQGREDAKTSIQTRGEWTRRGGHQVIGTVRATQVEGGGTDAAVAVTYRVPLDVPVRRRGGYGTLQGRVWEGDGGGGRGLARAVVRLNTGEMVVTDREGRFVIHGLRPGDYSVLVDSRSLGFGRIIADLEPPQVRVANHEVTTMDIEVVSASTVVVRLTLFEEIPVLPGVREADGDRETHRPVGGVSGEVVELTNGQETLRRLTDGEGGAMFAPLRPGRWALRIYDGALPAQHGVERPERELEVLPETRHEEDVRILPRKRRIQFIDGGA